MGNVARLCFAALVVSACGIAGYLAGRAPEEPVPEDSMAATHSSPRSQVREQRPERTDPLMALERLLAGDGHPGEIWNVVSRIPLARIPEALDAIKPSQWSEELAGALYYRWAEHDPEAALADAMEAGETFRSALMVQSVLCAWMKSDPEAAYHAVKDHRVFGYRARDMLVRTWTADTVFKNLERFPELLGAYCVANVGDETRRNAMLEALRDPAMKDREMAAARLFGAWGYKDFDAAMAAAEEENLLHLRKHVLDVTRNVLPHRALPWAAANGFKTEGPAWEEAFFNWVGFGGDKARAWLAERIPVWKAEGNHSAIAGFLAQDPGQLERLAEHWNDWSGMDPKAAAEWLDTAPAAVRERLVTTENDDD